MSASLALPYAFLAEEKSDTAGTGEWRMTLGVSYELHKLLLLLLMLQKTIFKPAPLQLAT